MSRRTNKIVGMVNFPVNSDKYENTKEGGMFVELWVVEKKIFECGVCCGYGNITASYAGELLGTDKKYNHDNYSQMNEKDFEKVLKDDIQQRFPLEEELFPFIHSEKEDPSRKYQSLLLLACITMGSTGWSGYKEEFWRCQYEDLNENGKLIYDALKKEYPKAELLLVTWLDT